MIDGDRVSIQSVSALDELSRFNTIKFTFTYSAALAMVKLYDKNELLISTLLDVESGVEYAIETGEAVASSAWDYFAMPPAAVDIIDFIAVAEDVIPTAQPTITDIFVGTRVTNTVVVNDVKKMYYVSSEVKDSRRINALPGYGTIIGGIESEWPRDIQTGRYYAQYEPYLVGDPPAPDTIGGNQFDYINHADEIVIEVLGTGGTLLPIIGNDDVRQMLNIGMLGSDEFIKYASSFK